MKRNSISQKKESYIKKSFNLNDVETRKKQREKKKEISEWLGGKMTEEEISEAFAAVMEDGLIGRDAFAGFISNARLM